MKIFNWVHRRFNNKENAKKNGDVDGDDNQFLVENKCNVLESWRGGILTIGTFGYDPLKDENEQSKHASSYYLYEEDEELEKEQVVSAEYRSHDEISEAENDVDDVGEEEEEEENPLVFAAYAHDDQELMEENWRAEFGFEYVMMEKKERTTLADLFYADSEDIKKQPIKKGEMIKDKSKCKHGVSFGKKLILEDARPIHKLHQLMRRMLKRKVHPDLSPVNSKVSAAIKCENNDYASLLPTQDATII